MNRKNPSLGITVWHHSASLVMPISDPRDRFFYPYHTPMKDTYNVCSWLRQLTLDTTARFQVTVITQVNKSVVYFIVMGVPNANTFNRA